MSDYQPTCKCIGPSGRPPWRQPTEELPPELNKDCTHIIHVPLGPPVCAECGKAWEVVPNGTE